MHHMSDDTLARDLLDRAKKAVSEGVTTRREEAAMSIRAAARGADMHHSEWLRIERGDIDPRLSTLLRMQRALKVDSLEALLGSTPSRVLAEGPGRGTTK
jgi:hypothetical protein